MVECAGLEIRYTVIPYRGFESLLLRHSQRALATKSRARFSFPTALVGLCRQPRGMLRCFVCASADRLHERMDQVQAGTGIQPQVETSGVLQRNVEVKSESAPP